MRGDEMPDGLPLPDQMAYTTLRNIYQAYSRKTISREAATAEKMRLRREYQMAKDQWAFWDSLAQHHVKVIRNTEAANTACRKNPTPENALRLCNVLDGIERT